MSIEKQVVRNSFWNSIFSVGNALLGFLLVPIMARQLGLSEFGLYIVISLFSLNGYGSILELGLQSSMTKFTAQYLAREDFAKISVLLSSVVVTFLGLASFASLLGLGSTDVLTRWLEVPAESVAGFEPSLRLVFFSYFFIFPNLAFAGLLQGHQQFGLLRTIDFLCSLGRNLITIFALFIAPSLFIAVAVSVFFSILQLILTVAAAHKYCPRVNFQFRLFSWHTLMEIRGMTAWVFIGRFCSTLFKQTDRLLVNQFLGAGAVALYEIATKVPYVLKSIFGQINEVLMPAASHLFEQTDAKIRLLNIFHQSLRWQLLIAAPAYFVFLFFPEAFLFLWAGAGYEHLATAVRLAVATNFILIFTTSGTALLLGMNRRVQFLSLASVAAGATNLALTFFWLPKWGMNGALMATIAGQLLQFPLIYFAFSKDLHVRFSQIFIDTGKILGPAILLAGPAFWISQGSWSKLTLATLILVWLILFYGLAGAFSLTADERALFRRKIHSFKTSKLGLGR